MDPVDEISAIGALADPVRRRLYDFVASQGELVSRESAAAEVGISLSKAKFHLERLVAEGLLEPEYRRLSGKSGPGAGRPAKLYRRAQSEFSVSLPERRYDLAGDVLATAIERAAAGLPVEEAVDAAAREAGRSAGAGAVPSEGAVSGEGAVPAAAEGAEERRLVAILSDLGYEPEIDGDTIRLRNCPFDSLAKDHQSLICGANHSYVQGVVEGAGCACMRADLDPSGGYCCVNLSRDDEH